MAKKLDQMTPFQRYVTHRSTVGGASVRENAVGDLYTGRGVNKSPVTTGSRSGLSYESGFTSGGRKVHLYNVGGNVERIVLPKKKKKVTPSPVSTAQTPQSTTPNTLYP